MNPLKCSLCEYETDNEDILQAMRSHFSIAHADIEYTSAEKRMGPTLQAEVEKQLLEDLKNYNIYQEGLTIDWSNYCPEGHCTRFLGGELENWSYIDIIDNNGSFVGEGWIDFIHDGDEDPLWVFWLYLSIGEGDNAVHVKNEGGIPLHIWGKLSEKTKKLCTASGQCDSKWHDVPLAKELEK
ncbi:MAG: hypothetical protein PHH70_05925 [Candidatus Gracilibacteria bacterium]|nr:hypothetical protein [Candidatus Gracilibacteria bacterium]